jgi:molybdate transport system substrate-binding protein
MIKTKLIFLNIAGKITKHCQTSKMVNTLICRWFAFILTLPVATVSAGELHIAVAANFTKPIKQLEQIFEEQYAHSLTVSLGSTGQLYAQIQHGAPYEVFLAADTKRPQLLIDKGMAINESFFIYAVGQLVLWSTQADLIDSDAQVLKSDNFQHIAIANPKTAPYGAAAQQVLQKQGVWESLQTKIVQANNITQTYQFVATGNAELGFIALSQYRVTEEKLKGSHWQVPQTLYDPIEQGAVLLKKGVTNPVAQAFFDFLQSPAAVKVIEDFGYSRFSLRVQNEAL